MRLATATLLLPLLQFQARAVLSQADPGLALVCRVRGSHDWLVTRPSPLDSVLITVPGAAAKICYSRPHARGRSVDSLVPPGLAWRFGANEPTTITVDNRLNIGGAVLAGGRYVILAVPGDTRWTLAFYSTPDTEPAKMFAHLTQVATGYGDVERVRELVEQFTIRTEGDSIVSSLRLEWGNWRVRVPLRAAL